MINCTFISRFSSGSSSDSLHDNYQVHAVPRVGERLMFLGANPHSEFVVKDVEHQIQADGSSHKIVVYYGDK